MVDWIGRTVSKVTIERMVGRGGMADVYVGTHTTLNRQVAVKILHGHLVEDESLMQRFRSEAQAVANLRHPNIVQIYDFDIIEDRPYIIMEKLDGPTLAEYVGRQRRTGQTIPYATTARLIASLASALDYAHARGIVHRDVKPSNVILRRDSGPWDFGAPLPDDAQAVLTDFGVAHISNTTLQTASGAMVGTPAYMSPEQVKGELVDSRSDVYSLGIMVYELVSGRLPFDSASEAVAATLVKHITEPPPPLPETPPRLQAVVFRALEKDRTGRYQMAGDLAFDLKEACGIPIGTEERKTRQEQIRLRFDDSQATLKHPSLSLPGAPASGRSSSRWLVVALLALVVIVAGIAAVLAAAGVLDGGEKDSGALVTGAANTRYGAVRFGSADAEGDRVTVRVSGIDLPPPDAHYEVWLLGDETRLSIGVLDLDDSGAGEIAYVAPDGSNLLAAYGRFEITSEPSPDPNPLPTGAAVFSGAVPTESLMHIRHLMSGFGSTPGAVGLTIGVMRSAGLLRDLAQDLSAAYESEDIAEVKRIAEAVVNIIEGESGADYGDLDGDGDLVNPGDGYGLLPNSQNSGYIQTSIEHARFAAGTSDATPHVTGRAQAFEITAQNVGGWAAQLRDVALAILQSDEVTGEQVSDVVRLVELLVNGQDVNGNGVIEPVTGEGGVKTMVHYALSMGDMVVLKGANRVPDPTDNTPDPAVFPEYEYEDF